MNNKNILSELKKFKLLKKLEFDDNNIIMNINNLFDEFNNTVYQYNNNTIQKTLNNKKNMGEAILQKMINDLNIINNIINNIEKNIKSLDEKFSDQFKNINKNKNDYKRHRNLKLIQLFIIKDIKLRYTNINDYMTIFKKIIANIINQEYNKLNKELNEINKKKDKCYDSNLIKNLINKKKIFEKYTNDLNNKNIKKNSNEYISYNIYNNKYETIMVNNPLLKKKLTNFLEKYKSIQSIQNTKPYINKYLPNIKTIPSNYGKIISSSKLTRDSKKFLINYIKKKNINSKK